MIHRMVLVPSISHLMSFDSLASTSPLSTIVTMNRSRAARVVSPLPGPVADSPLPTAQTLRPTSTASAAPPPAIQSSRARPFPLTADLRADRCEAPAMDLSLGINDQGSHVALKLQAGHRVVHQGPR